MDNINQSDKEDYHFKLKITVVGDVHCGKSTFLDTLTQGNGKVVDLETSEEISERVSLHLHDHFLYKIIFWEVPGKERVLKFIANYVLGSHVVVVLFDVNKIHSFEKAEKILKAIEICGVKTKILVGSKTDMINTKKHSDPVLQVDAEKLAKAYGCEYYPCNSTLPESVNHIYNSIMSKISSLNDNPLDLNKLLEKNIVTGKRVYSHPDFIKSMKEASLFNN